MISINKLKKLISLYFNNFVIICSPDTLDKIREEHDKKGILMETSCMNGTLGRPMIRGVPIIDDKDCNHEIFIIDLNKTNNLSQIKALLKSKKVKK